MGSCACPTLSCPMKLAPLLLFTVLAGCSSEAQNASQIPSSDVGLTNEQKIEKIQSDPNIPDGLKQIQTETLRRQPGTPR